MRPIRKYGNGNGMNFLFFGKEFREEISQEMACSSWKSANRNNLK